jgi:hypothetical protein
MAAASTTVTLQIKRAADPEQEGRVKWIAQSSRYVIIRPDCSIKQVYIGSPMVCDVIGILSNQLCVFYPRALAKHWRFFLSHIYNPIPIFINFILWKAWRRNTQCDKNLSHEYYHIDIKENM